MASGIKVVAETEGTGARSENAVIGSRRLVAGVEAALIGMREGGYRKVRISPHLAYRGTGVEGKIPPNAVLIYEFWLQVVEKRGLTPRSRADALKRAAQRER